MTGGVEVSVETEEGRLRSGARHLMKIWPTSLRKVVPNDESSAHGDLK